MISENGKLKPAVKEVLEERAEEFVLNEYEGLGLDKKTRTDIALLVALRELEGNPTNESDVILELVNSHLQADQPKYEELISEIQDFVEDKYQERTLKRREELAD